MFCPAAEQNMVSNLARQDVKFADLWQLFLVHWEQRPMT